MHDMHNIAVDATFTQITDKKRPLHQLIALHSTLLLSMGMKPRGQGREKEGEEGGG